MLILASSSIYRKELLSRIIEDYQIEIPDIDESKYDHEDAKTSAIRLALEKAEKIALTLPDNFIIGADQTAESNHIQINKPNNYKEAFDQLKKLSGKDVSFYSAICLICKSKKIKYEYVSEVNVKYKNLSENEIESYLKYEKPYGCLGCIKSEGLGISLLEKVSSDDPTAIIGLPLIALSKCLKIQVLNLKVSKGNLYLIPSPIEQNSTKNFLISHQHEEIKKIKYFFVENQKTARAILKKLELNTPLQEIIIFENNQNTKLTEIDPFIEPIYSGHDFGLISDSGLPCIADPGNMVVYYAHHHNIQIKPLIGPSSIFLSLMASGFNGQNFEFVGYLPIDLNEKKKKLVSFQESINTENKTFIFIETPYRNNKLLGELIDILNTHTRLCVAYNLTASDERIISKKIADWKKIIYPSWIKNPAYF